MASAEEIDIRINQRGGFKLPIIRSDDLAAAFAWATNTVNTVNFFSVENLFAKHDRVLSIQYINNSKIGAFCATTSPICEQELGLDFVGVHAGSIPAIYNLYLRLLCRPDVFPDVGNSRLELAERAYTPHLATSVEIDGEFGFVRPNCPVRFSFALCLADLAFGCLLFHEIAHLKNGHVDWMESLSPEDKYVPGTKPPMLTNDMKLKLQACEMDADSEAIRLTINMAFESAGNFHKIVEEIDISQRTAMNVAMLQLMQSQKHLIRYIVYSVYLLFRLFDSKLWTLSDQLLQNHPTWPARQRLVIQTVAAVIGKNRYYQYPVDEFFSDIPPLLQEAEEHYALLQERVLDGSRINSAWSAETFDEYRLMLNSAWLEILPSLQVFQRSKGKLAPGI